jgi:hypothetical protein
MNTIGIKLLRMLNGPNESACVYSAKGNTWRARRLSCLGLDALLASALPLPAGAVYAEANVIAPLPDRTEQFV